MKKVLVSGGAGFIGSHLVDKLVKEDYKVVCLDDLSTGILNNVNECCEFIKGDVNNYNDLKNVFDSYNFNWVFHYAFVVGVKRTIENPVGVLNCIDGIKNVLELSRRNNVEKVLFASSSEVYGNPVEIPETEDGHVNAKLPYAVIKLAGENFFQAYYEQYGLKTCSLRLFNVYGPRQDSSQYGFVTGIFIKQVLHDEPLTIYGDGTQTRDFVFIDDNVEATICAMKSEKTNGEVINIGSGKPTTILDLATLILKLCGKETNNFKFLEDREYEIKHRFPDISKMLKLVGYRPSYKLEDGLKKTIEWYKSLK